MGKSRAGYFRERRQNIGQFYAMVDKDILEKLDLELEKKNMSRVEWLRRCIERELTDREE